jgi:rifampicin phosphotransferase
LQARPITTLFPLPEPRPHDTDLHAYISFSHFQVMTDAMPPLATSVWRLLFPFGRTVKMLENPVLTAAGGRLYVDASYALRHPVLRRMLPRLAGENIDALIGAALQKLAVRPEFAHGPHVNVLNALRGFAPILGRVFGHLLFPASGNVAQIDERVAKIEARIAAPTSLKTRLQIAMHELRGLLGGETIPLVAEMMTGILSDALLRRVATPFAQAADLAAVTAGLQGNVTTEMGLAVADLADTARDFPALVAQLRRTDLSALERLRVEHLPGGTDFLHDWQAFLNRYGARGPSEIDLSRQRWREDPSSLLNMVVGNLELAKPGAHRTRIAQQVLEASQAEQRIVRAAGSVRGLPVRHLLRVVRTYLPLREHLKYLIVRVLDLVKRVVLEVGEVMAERGQFVFRDDVWFLTLPELHDALNNSSQPLLELVATRRRNFERESRLTPPRAMTSDGEQINVSHVGDHLPEGALAGQGVSAGIVEGVVRVILHPDETVLRPGEILVAPFTDPAWTPLFVTAAGLVTEIGGLMTHGSLVAREYGIPAVVGVANATQVLRTGQRVRVNGDLGYVQVLEDKSAPITHSLETVGGAMVDR